MLASYRDNDFVIKGCDNGTSWTLLDTNGNTRDVTTPPGNREAALTHGFKSLVEFNEFYFDEQKFCHFKLDIYATDEADGRGLDELLNSLAQHNSPPTL
jgi:hypothetical protein